MNPPEVAGQVVTFYSYKGGTGRTMALANIACLLAHTVNDDGGVLMIDWDLEAPGLHRFFQGLVTRHFAEAPDPAQALDDQPGLIDLLVELDLATRDAGSDVEGEQLAAAALDRVDWRRFVIETDIPALHLLKAGCFDDGYSGLVNRFDWEGLYTRSPMLFSLFAEQLARRYRYVLIDSRTGLTDTSGICTTLMPERLVVVFTPNRQSLTGVLDLVRNATSYRRATGDLRPLIVFPLPSRIELSEADLRQDWRLGNPTRGIDGYQSLFEAAFREAYDLPDCDLAPYFDEVQIPHVPRYAYGEEIAVLTERRGDSLSLARRYETLADRLLTLDGPWLDTGTVKVLPTTISPAAGQATARQPSPVAAVQQRVPLLSVLLPPLLALVFFVVLAFVFLRPPAINSFYASARAVAAGGTNQLNWSGDRIASVEIDPPVSPDPSADDGQVTVTPEKTTDYVLTAHNWIGLSSTARARVAVVNIKRFAANTTNLIKEGQEVQLSWDVDADSVSIEPSDEIKDPRPTGDAKVHPSGNTTYTLTAHSGDVDVTQQIPITIGLPTLDAFSISDPPSGTRVFPGGQVKLTWRSTGATRAVLTSDKGEVTPGHTELDVSGGPPATVQPSAVGDTTYTLTVSNAGGEKKDTIKVNVSPIAIQFDADPSPATAGQPVRLRWRVDGANDDTQVSIDNGIGKVPPIGDKSITLTDNTDYRLTVTNPDGSTQTQNLTVSVMAPAPKVNVFTAPTQQVSPGNQVRLTWVVDNADSVEIRTDQGDLIVQTKQLSGSVIDIPPATTTYILTAIGPSGQSKASFSVVVGSPTPIPAVTRIPQSIAPSPVPRP